MNIQSREANSIRNVIVGGFNQVFILFLNLVSKTIFIKVLGTGLLGINGLFTNIFVLLSFAEYGVGSVMVYSLYKPISEEDEKKITSLYMYFRRIYIIMAIVTMGIGILIIPTLSIMVNIDIEYGKLILYYFLFLLYMINSNIFLYKVNLIIANQKEYIVGLYRFVFDGISLILQIVILIYTKNYILYLIIVVTKNIFFNLSIGNKVNKLYPFLKDEMHKEGLTTKEKKHIFVRIKDVFIYKFSRALLTGTDNILISILVGTVWVGYYSNYDLIVVGVLSLISTFFSAITASVGNLIVTEKIENQYKIYKITQLINYWIAGFATTCLFVLFQDFIYLWIGKDFLFNWKIVAVIVFNFYLICSRHTIKVFREAAGMFEKIKYIMLIASVINIILSIILGYLFGVFGILLATSITALLTYFWYEAKIILESRFGHSVYDYIRGQIKSFILALISIIITSICASMIKEVTIISFIIKMGICIIVPNIFYILVLRREKEFQEIFKIILRNYKKLI